ncbi:MAG: hypothetical protein FWE20_02080, partial [Defluviitaleaceae bacterium]|nr:hypothetical protein [Defluviitaleaceae bacterium]
RRPGSPQSPVLALWGGLSVPAVVRKDAVCRWHTFSIRSASVGGGTDDPGSPRSPILASWGGIRPPRRHSHPMNTGS